MFIIFRNKKTHLAQLTNTELRQVRDSSPGASNLRLKIAQEFGRRPVAKPRKKVVKKDTEKN